MAGTTAQTEHGERPSVCGRLHLGYRCTRSKGHDGLHQARYVDGTLMHSWAERDR